MKPIFTIPEIVANQQERMDRYKKLIEMASSHEEQKALFKAYEISRLIFINHEDVRQRDNMLLKDDTDG